MQAYINELPYQHALHAMHAWPLPERAELQSPGPGKCSRLTEEWHESAAASQRRSGRKRRDPTPVCRHTQRAIERFVYCTFTWVHKTLLLHFRQTERQPDGPEELFHQAFLLERSPQELPCRGCPSPDSVRQHILVLSTMWSTTNTTRCHVYIHPNYSVPTCPSVR